MPRLLFAAVVASLLALATASASIARLVTVTVSVGASLDAKHVVPAGSVSAARGRFTATLTKNSDGSGTLAWKLTLSGLSGPPTMIETRFGAKGTTGAVAVVLCSQGPCSPQGTVPVSSTVAGHLLKKKIYISVDTAKHPKGEIRGEIAQI